MRREMQMAATVEVKVKVWVMWPAAVTESDWTT